MRSLLKLIVLGSSINY